MTLLAGLFLIAHGLVHVGLWARPFDPSKGPFDPSRSWLLSRAGRASWSRPLAIALASLSAAVFVVAGIAVLAGAEWAGGAAVAGALCSLLLTALYLHPWLVFNVAIDLAIIAIVRISG